MPRGSKKSFFSSQWPCGSRQHLLVFPPRRTCGNPPAQSGPVFPPIVCRWDRSRVSNFFFFRYRYCLHFYVLTNWKLHLISCRRNMSLRFLSEIKFCRRIYWLVAEDLIMKFYLCLNINKILTNTILLFYQ